MYTIKTAAEGLAPMMMDRFFSPESVERGKAKTKAAKTWKDELRLKLYEDASGLYLPADNVRMTLIGNKARRGAAKILGADIERKSGTKYESWCEGCVWILGMEEPLKVRLTRGQKNIVWDGEYDERSFPMDKGGRQITRRPIVKMPWEMQFFIQVTDDRLDESKVRELFDVAGTRCGVGAYGPTFGRFLITEWQVKLAS